MDRIKGMTEYMIIFGKLTGLPGVNGDHLQQLFNPFSLCVEIMRANSLNIQQATTLPGSLVDYAC